jgi:hypothetical protein
MKIIINVFMIFAAITGKDVVVTGKGLKQQWENIAIDSSGAVMQSAKRVAFVSARKFDPKNKFGYYDYKKLSDSLSFLRVGLIDSTWLINDALSFENLAGFMDTSKPTCIFIHGHAKTMPMNIESLGMFAELYGVNVLVFDWPTYHRKFKNTIKTADNASYLLAETFDLIEEHINILPGKNIHIFAHSAGNFLLRKAIEERGLEIADKKYITSLIMNAPVIGADNYEEFLERLNDIDEIHIVGNQQDIVIKGAGVAMRSKQLGRHRPDNIEQYAVYHDLTEYLGKEHAYFYGNTKSEHKNKEIYLLYRTLLY